MARTVVWTLIAVALVVVASPWRGFVRNQRRETGVPVVEFAVFEAGFGMDWHTRVAREYEEKRRAQGRPVEVEVWGDPRVLDKVRPRILSKQPPALIHAYLPYWTLALSGVLLPFDEMLDRPAVGANGRTIRETFYPGSLEMFRHRGQTYVIPIAYNAWVMWYDKRLFRERGWHVPHTWQELTTLCERIKAAGLAPIAFQGKYDVYGNCYLYYLIQQVGGIELFDRCQAMEPGAFTHPDTIQAATLLQDLAVTHFQPGSGAMSHTEAQNEFCMGRTAMVACGLWFENEMKATLPDEMELSAFPLPPIKGSKGGSDAIYAGPAEMVYLMRDGQNTDEALDFMVELVSVDNMRSFASRLNTLAGVREANRDAELSPAMRTIREFVDRKSPRFMESLSSYAITWDAQIKRPAIKQLTQGRITPREFCETLERGMDAFRNDPEFMRPD